MACVADGCTSHPTRSKLRYTDTVNLDEKLSFHIFPKDQNLRDEWIRRLGRMEEDWIPTRFSRVCSKHFSMDSFILKDKRRYRYLKDDAMPVLYLPDVVEEDSQKTSPVSPNFMGCRKESTVPFRVYTKKLCGTEENIPITNFRINAQAKYEQRERQETSLLVTPAFMDESTEENIPSTFIPNIPLWLDTQCKREPQTLETETETDSRQHRRQRTLAPVPTTQGFMDECVQENINDREIPQSPISNHVREKDYIKKNQSLEKQLARVRKVSDRRLRKINALSKQNFRLSARNTDLYKQNFRLSARNTDLYNALMDLYSTLKNENIEAE